jgi:hypothetical protein
VGDAETNIRAAITIHDAMVLAARTILLTFPSFLGTSEPDFEDDDLTRVTLDGDIVTFHWSETGSEFPFAKSVKFPAAYLWDVDLLKTALHAHAEQEEAKSALFAAEAEAVKREQYERLKRHFEGDHRKA